MLLKVHAENIADELLLVSLGQTKAKTRPTDVPIVSLCFYRLILVFCLLQAVCVLFMGHIDFRDPEEKIILETVSPECIYYRTVETHKTSSHAVRHSCQHMFAILYGHGTWANIT